MQRMVNLPERKIHKNGTGKRGPQYRERHNETITENTPLTPFEQKFVTEYIRCGNGATALRTLGIKLKNDGAYYEMSKGLKAQPNIKAEINKAMEGLKNDTIATAQEVMGYFTAVMRGQVKDQFGLEAPLSERTKAAQEIAKRTVDIENRNDGKADQLIAIKLDWSRD